MRATGKEMAAVTDAVEGGKEKIHAWLVTASPREIQDYIHNISTDSNSYLYQRARTALEIRLAEDAKETADKLSTQTETLIKFTRGLYFFTIALTVFAIIQIIIMVMEYLCKNL